MGRTGHGQSAKKANKCSRPGNVNTTALCEGEALQQRGDRKKGAEAVPTYKLAAAKYRQALSGTELSPEERARAHFGLGETLQSAASCIVSGSHTVPEAQLKTAEEAAQQTAKEILEQAVGQYKLVQEANGDMRVDALVNCGNTLAAWAELVPRDQALQLLQDAVVHYRAALQKEEDAMTYSNLGDAMVSAAERLGEGGNGCRSRELYGEAMAVYGSACSMSSSENGDDLPGLLYNWAVGLHSAGTNLRDAAALEEAAGKLRAARDFNRCDIAVFNALGDTLVAQADLEPDPDRQQVLLQQAMEEGFGAALKIDRSHSDAHVGTAEVLLQLGRRTSGVEREGLYRQSAAAYSAALQKTLQLGTFKERCDIRYNFACASCLAGNSAAAEATLVELLSYGGVALEDVLQDMDLQGLSGSKFWDELQKHEGTEALISAAQCT